MPERVRLHEVGPRDGLQNEPEVLPTDVKIAMIEALVAAGHRDIEVTSFVRPRWIPQLADAGEVVRRLRPVDGVRYWALVPNQRGFERALESGVRHVATFMSSSESHNKRNVNRTIRESLAGLSKVIANAQCEGVRVRSYLSTAFGCPYEGAVPVERVVDLAVALREAGSDIIALGDTTGMGTPYAVRAVIDALVAAGVGLDAIAVHFHDTRGTALVNAFAALRAGVRHLDAASAGLGGCPYAAGAAGNLATEDLVHLLHSLDFETGVDLDGAVRAASVVEQGLGRDLPGRYYRFVRGMAVPALSAKSA